MVKKASNKRLVAQAPSPAPKAIPFPRLSEKSHIRCHTFLEDQILLLSDVLTPSECRTFVDFIDSQPLELTPPKKRGEADRVNYRISISSPEFAGRLWTILHPHLPSFPYPASMKQPDLSARAAHSLNSNIRLYKYTPSQHFNPHYDDSTRDAKTGAVSEWTLLIYLTGVEDAVQGGETIFYPNSKAKASESLVAPLTRGTALLHRHGNECLLHEGSQVRNGTKYVLRSDVMFLN
ncbi:hypothetical protein DFH94DRAFT_632704 [Russula ochroleuca]|jgi:hypothetical protein|uniref:Fe2OG dioxygenase domain-containing protein n=1 Tax=Russula ochroleuca TaxID=152965 RepID=A0A9P5MV69_9AGAM|nr:hypothetical protein DFH94DRAFT_632704 [Russula ochroleuca]